MAKIRFQPGDLVRKKKGNMRWPEPGTLLCVIAVYRTKDSPNIWNYLLEERKELGSPETPLSQIIERLTDGASENFSDRIFHEPVWSVGDIPSHNWYAHGDQYTATTKEMLNEFQLVSSGEIIEQQDRKV